MKSTKDKLTSLPRFFILFTALTLTVSASSKELCELPQHWLGGWFQSGVGEVISISRSEISTKGVCVESSGEKYIFKDRKDGSYRCVVISEKHLNILQYKETLSEPSTKKLLSLCSKITGDALLFSMFRRDASPASCPLKGPLTFSYNSGHGQCATPASTISSCTSDSKLVFKYQACPDVQGTESLVEEVMCLGFWKEGTTRYFIGKIRSRKALTDEDRFRCFAWEKSRDYRDSEVDYRMAQSGDATCNGVSSAYDGSKTLRIMKAASHSGCEFPSWITSHRRWFSLDRIFSYVVSHKNTTLRLHHSHAPKKVKEPVAAVPSVRQEVDSLFLTRLQDPDSESRYLCSHSLEVTAQMALLVLHFTVGCSTGYVCAAFHRRDDHIIEMQQGSWTLRLEEACHPTNFNASIASHVTLTSPALSLRSCPFMGIWSSGEKSKSCGQTRLRAGCDTHYKLEFEDDCEDKPIQVFHCHGHWAEGGAMYVLTSPRDQPSQRQCLVASGIINPSILAQRVLESNLSVENITKRSLDLPPGSEDLTEALYITTHLKSCPRQQISSSSPLKVNLTSKGECAVSSGEMSQVATFSVFWRMWYLVAYLIFIR